MQQSTITAILKIVFMILFFAIVSFVGTIPILSKTFKSNPLFRMIGSTFAGALFINVAVLHILPQSADTLQKYLQDGDTDLDVFPLANLLMMVGFLITVFFTKIMSSHQDMHSHQHDHHHAITSNKQNQKTGQIKQSLISQQQLNKQKEQLNHEYNKQVNHQHKAQLKHQHKQQKKRQHFNQAYVLTLAIYFHTIFQGIAIGVQTSLPQFLGISIAIAFHKWADALSMGCHYKAKNIPKKTSIILIIGQAVLNVLSIGLGWLIALEGDLMEAVFLSLSAGTFLAISTMELLGEQLGNKNYKWGKFALLLFATGFISAVWFVENRIF